MELSLSFANNLIACLGGFDFPRSCSLTFLAELLPVFIGFSKYLLCFYFFSTCCA
jgi:hypothetical protein